MNFGQAREVVRRDPYWIGLILASTAVALAANAAGLLLDITIVLPHLFYIPIIITAYRYPRQGLLFSACISILYIALLAALAIDNTNELVAGLSRAVVFVAIGWIISVLSVHLAEERERYRGLFDHAEAGAAVVRVTDHDLVIEEANYRLAQTLKTTPALLAGKKLADFWEDNAERERFAGRVRTEGACYAFEARWRRGDGSPVDILISAGKISPAASVITAIDITEQKNTEASLKNANGILNVLSRLTRNDLTARVDEVAGILAEEQKSPAAAQSAGLILRIDRVVRSLKRRLDLAGSFQDIGSGRPAWQPLQAIIQEEIGKHRNGNVSIRPWLERLEVYADNNIREVFFNLIDNAIRYGKGTTEIVIAYHIVPDGLEIIIEDDGCGIPMDAKESIFEYGSMTHGGFGLFVDRQILGVTGITLQENGAYGSGARFVMHVPQERFRIV